MLPIGALSAQIGVSEDVLRKWEARHGWTRPLRTAGGTRLYDERQVVLLREAKREIDRGTPVSQALKNACNIEVQESDTAPDPSTGEIFLQHAVMDRLPALRRALQAERR